MTITGREHTMHIALALVCALLTACAHAASVETIPSVVDFGYVGGSPFGDRAVTGDLAFLFHAIVGGTDAERDVVIVNHGPGTLTIMGFESDGVAMAPEPESDYSFTGGVVFTRVVPPPAKPCGDAYYDAGSFTGPFSVLPIVLQEGQSCTITLWSRNEGLGDAQGQLRVITDAPTSPHVVPVRMRHLSGTYYAFTATDNQPVTTGILPASGCGFTDAGWIAPPDASITGPLTGYLPGLNFPAGLFRFTAENCPAGITATVLMWFPNPIRPDTQYWKFGPTADRRSPHWYRIPITIEGNMLSFQVTDGGPGDDDLVADGTIHDQGGPAILGDAPSIPVLSRANLALMAFALGALACAAPRFRRRVRRRVL